MYVSIFIMWTTPDSKLQMEPKPSESVLINVISRKYFTGVEDTSVILEEFEEYFFY